MAIYHKVIKIDVYCTAFQVAIADNWEEAISRFQLKLEPNDTNSHALTIDNSLIGVKSPYNLIVFIDTSERTIVHESYHMTNLILYDLGHTVVVNNDGKIFDEPHAYLLEYIVSKITKFVNSKKKVATLNVGT
jgi:hypothetical protein